MTNRSFLYAAFVSAVLLGNCNVMVTSQLGSFDVVKFLNNITWEGKADLLKGYLLKDPNHELFKQLQNVLVAAFPILSYDVPPNNLFHRAALPWALDKLPDLLKNKVFLDIMKTFIHELNRPGIKPEYLLNSGNNTLDRNYFMYKLLRDLDYKGMAAGVLTSPSVRNLYMRLMSSVPDIIPYESTDRQLNGKCYNDTMAFLTGVLAGQDWAVDSKLLA